MRTIASWANEATSCAVLGEDVAAAEAVRPWATTGLCWRSSNHSSVRKGRWNQMVCEVTAEVNAVPLPRLAEALQRAQRGADECQIGGVGGQCGCELGVDGGCAHPELELGSRDAGGVEVDRGPGLPRDEVVVNGVVGRDRADGVGISWCSGPSSEACIETAAVAITPFDWRAVIEEAWRTCGPPAGAPPRSVTGSSACPSLRRARGAT